MGARSGYTLLTALFIGVAGFMGGLTIFFEVLPKVVLFPILIFVGLEITSQTFRVVPRMYYPALALSMLPAVAYVALLLVKSFYAPAQPQRPDAIHGLLTLRCLANGPLGGLEFVRHEAEIHHRGAEVFGHGGQGMSVR